MNYSSIGFTVLMFIAGVGIPTMAAMNAGLGARIGHPIAAAFLLFFVALTVAGTALLFVGLPDFNSLPNVPFYYFFAGVLIAFYLLSITWAAPRIGLGNAIFIVLFGQLCSAALIDHFGAFGAKHTPIDWQRALGLLVMGLGVFLARNGD